MSERHSTPADSDDASERVTSTDESANSYEQRVREVVGRRGYDEAEDETATEDEDH